MMPLCQSNIIIKLTMKQLHYTIRTLVRGRAAVVVKLASLTLGLVVGVLLFSQIAYELNFDRFYPNPETLVTLRMRDVTKGVPEDGYNYGTYRPAAADLSEAMPELIESAAAGSDASVTEVSACGRKKYADGEQARYNALINSASYKIGRAITYIPRKIRALFRKKK